MPGSRASVVIPCHAEQRWPRLVSAVRSAQAQRELPVTVLRNRFARGASGNRNTGAFHTTTPLIALLDDDAIAAPGWLAGLTRPFEDPAVVGTGGAIRPEWPRHPAWLPGEFLWTVGASYTGMPTRTAPVRNVWSGNMAVRRDIFEAVGGFRVGFGKVGDRARPEDTELCLRMSAWAGGHWMYVPDALIDHLVPAERATFGSFLNRCYHEGRGKVEMARLFQGPSLGSERDYLRRTLPRAVGRGLAGTLRGRPRGAVTAAVVLAGVTAAGVGGAVELVRGRPRPLATPVEVGLGAAE